MSDENKMTSEDFEATLKVEGGQFTFLLPALDLVTKGNSLEEAYAKFDEKKRRALSQMQEAGISPEISELSVKETSWRPSYVNRETVGDDGGFGIFLKKSLVIFLIVAATLYFVADRVSHLVESTIEIVGEKIPSKPGRVIEEELYNAVGHPISSVRQVKIIESIRVIVKRLRPFVLEFKELFRDEPRSSEVKRTS